MAGKKKIDAAQILSAFGAKPQQQNTQAKQATVDTPTTQATIATVDTMDRQATVDRVDTMATIAKEDTQATMDTANSQYRHIAISNDIWGKVKALQGQTGAPLNHIINRALARYIQEIEEAHGTITTTKIELI